MPVVHENQVHWFKDVHAHGVIAVFMVGDLFAGSARFHDLHSLVVLFCTAVYVLWNLGVTFTIHWLYPILKWDTPDSVVLALGAMLFAQGVFFSVSALSYLRDAVAAQVNGAEHGARRECCCCGWRCTTTAAVTDVEAPRQDSDKEHVSSEDAGMTIAWSEVYPIAFSDDNVAWPCHTCKQTDKEGKCWPCCKPRDCGPHLQVDVAPLPGAVSIVADGEEIEEGGQTRREEEQGGESATGHSK
jgi:hypothetical protein